MRSTKDLVTLEVNVGRQGMPVSLGWKNPTSTFISCTDSLMVIYETIDTGLRPDPSLARSNSNEKDDMVSYCEFHIIQVG